MALLKKILIFTLLSLSIIELVNANDKTYPPNQAMLDVESLIANHVIIYNDDYNLFWYSLNRLREVAYSVDTFDAINQFMQLLRIDNLPAEVEEFLSEGYETLCVEKSDLFEKVINQLEPCLTVKLNKKLDHPLFYEAEELKKCRNRVHIP